MFALKQVAFQLAVGGSAIVPPQQPPQQPLRRSDRQRKEGRQLRSPWDRLPGTRLREQFESGKFPRWCRLSCLPRERIPLSFWGKLLGNEDDGWLDGMHMEAWVRYLQASRSLTSDWTCILPDHFTLTVQYDIASILPVASGLQLASDGFPHWSLVRKIFIPICLNDRHWVAGYLNLETMVFTIYDTLRIPRISQPIVEQVSTFGANIPGVLRQLNDPRGELLFSINYEQNIPRQTGAMGDCGPWVARFLRDLVHGDDPTQRGYGDEVCREWREEMFELLWATRVEE